MPRQPMKTGLSGDHTFNSSTKQAALENQKNNNNTWIFSPTAEKPLQKLENSWLAYCVVGRTKCQHSTLFGTATPTSPFLPTNVSRLANVWACLGYAEEHEMNNSVPLNPEQQITSLPSNTCRILNFAGLWKRSQLRHSLNTQPVLIQGLISRATRGHIDGDRNLSLLEYERSCSYSGSR